MGIVKRITSWIMGSKSESTVAPRTFTRKKVLIERYVEQVIDGSHYKGYVKIADIELDYELVFAVPIPRLNDMKPGTVTALRRVIQITVRRNEANIELTDEEYDFFFQLVVMFAMDFFFAPQTRANNRLLHGHGDGRGFATLTGASAFFVVTSNVSYDLEPGLCEMLSAPKFGCALAD